MTYLEWKIRGRSEFVEMKIGDKIEKGDKIEIEDKIEKGKDKDKVNVIL